MHRRAALSLSVLLLTTGGASLAHAEHTEPGFNLQFGNLTSVELGDNTFSVDIQVTADLATAEHIPSDPGLWISSFQMNFALDGLALQSIELLEPASSWTFANNDHILIGYNIFGDDIQPTLEPVGLFRMNLAISESPSSGPLSITLSEILMSNLPGDSLSVQQDSYTFTIPAPATLALLAGGLGGFRRRRAG